MLFVLGVLFMIVGVAASIALHEMGHMVPAKKFGVRVPQYMIGFGPTFWSKKRGETEYGVKGIPLGGYVRMIGMYPPKAGDPDGAVRASSTGRFGQLADEVREQTFEEMHPGDENRVFYKLRTWQKVTVMFGGPFMNLVIAAVVMTVMVCGVGLPKLTGTKVTSLPSPMFHALGYLHGTLAMFFGSTLVLRRRFKPATVLEDLEKHKVTAMVVVAVVTCGPPRSRVDGSVRWRRPARAGRRRRG